MARKLATADRVGLEELLDFVRPRHRATLVTRRRDGSPQVSPVTCGLDDEGRIVVSTYPARAKTVNARRDPRVSLNVCDPDDITRYFEVRGRVVGITADGGAEHIEALAQRYTGRPYAWYGGRDQVRLVVTIAADKVRAPW